MDRAYGYLLLPHRRGWKQVCDERMLPSGGLDEYLVGGEVLEVAEGDAGADRASGADGRRSSGRRGRSRPGALRTAASVAAELAETFAVRLGWWEGKRR